MKKLYALLALITFSLSFGASKVVADNNPNNAKHALQSDDLISQIIQSIPSPLEVTMLMKEQQIVYDQRKLNDPDNRSKYTSDVDKAINLGIYSTDLGYANIYGQTQDALKYLSAVNDLSESLNIAEHFDYQFLKKLAESTDDNNLAKLIETTTVNFEKVNNDLREEQSRPHLSILLLAGGWIEATYLMTMINERKPSKVLKEKIAEQKLVLDRLLLAVQIYRGKAGMEEVYSEMMSLQRVFDEIEIETIEGNGPTQRVENGQIIIEDGSRSNVIMDDKHIEEITRIVGNIRAKRTKNN